VFGCNIPFDVVEHPLFKAMVSALRPGYTPPTRKSLGTKQLDSVHNKLQSRMKSILKDKIITMPWPAQPGLGTTADPYTWDGRGRQIGGRAGLQSQNTSGSCLYGLVG